MSQPPDRALCEALEAAPVVAIPQPDAEPGGRTHLFNFGRNAEGAPYNIVRVYESGHIECFDIQPASDVQEIIDSVSDYREINRLPHPGRHGRLGARIPITLYIQWRELWRRVYRSYMSWAEFEARQLNKPEYRQLRAIDEIPLFTHQKERWR